jgi:hypothetical protein
VDQDAAAGPAAFRRFDRPAEAGAGSDEGSSVTIVVKNVRRPLVSNSTTVYRSSVDAMVPGP